MVGLDAGDHRRVCGCGRRRHRDATDRGLQGSARYATLHLPHGGRQARTAMTRLLATADDRLPLPRVDGRLIDAIHQSGLVGRGGAGFPTAIKWRAVADRSRGNAVIVVNGAEGEPRSQKDRLVMTTKPDLVLDGAFVAARELHANRVILYIGERHIEARDAMLRAPTLVQNVETLMRVALLAWGLPAGGTMVTLAGAIARPGVLEVDPQTTVGEAIASAGGMTEAPRAILVGGYFGRWLDVQEGLAVSLAHGQGLGCGVI